MHVNRQGDSLDRLAARLLQTRWLVRALVPVFRAGLGGLAGGLLLLLRHQGRVSGRQRFVVLEVVDRPAPNEVLVASGFGTAAQWYRNLAANEVAFVTIAGRRAHQATPAFLTARQSKERLAAYAGRHPRAWARLSGAMAIAQGVDTPDIRLVRLRWEPR